MPPSFVLVEGKMNLGEEKSFHLGKGLDSDHTPLLELSLQEPEHKKLAMSLSMELNTRYKLQVTSY